MLTPRQLARRIRTVLAALLGVFVISYTLDFLVLRFRMHGASSQFGSVRVRRYYAVKLKNRSTSYLFDQPQDQPCVRSLYPHLGASPCWYLARHREQRIDINAGPPEPLINTP